jgi:hypothetical protein
MSVVSGAIVAAVLGVFVWLKIVRPVRADLAWRRQAVRIDEARARRLARRARAAKPA